MQYQSLGQAYKQMRELKEGFTPAHEVKSVIGFFIFLILLQIAFAIMAIWCLFQCHAVNKIPTWATVLIIILFFIPDVGFLAAIIVIIYYFFSCKGSASYY